MLYVGNACPWCHRVTLTIALRGLQSDIQIGKLTDDAERASRGGWVFETQNPDPVFRGKDLREVYDALSKNSKGEGYKGRCTAPLLVDAELKTPVNNESADICLMLNSVNFDGARSKGSDTVDRQAVDLRPAHLLTEIDDLNEYIYKKLNNGTYRAGFATTQAAHNKAAVDVVDALELMNHKLAGNRFLLGDKVTESDVRLFPTIVRFDTVYASLFKCGSRKVSDLPNLRAWMLDFYNLPGVAKTVDVDGYRSSYFGQLFPLNPGGIVPIGPTAKDLGLGTDPGRGSVDREDVFHLKE
ncbi:glutathione S-transferase C-terminal domain-containing protein [bacterium]|nr:glutathione S-transferase C-terminal domain-containing protein [bacterium]